MAMARRGGMVGHELVPHLKSCPGNFARSLALRLIHHQAPETKPRQSLRARHLLTMRFDPADQRLRVPQLRPGLL